MQSLDSLDSRGWCTNARERSLRQCRPGSWRADALATTAIAATQPWRCVVLAAPISLGLWLESVSRVLDLMTGFLFLRNIVSNSGETLIRLATTYLCKFLPLSLHVVRLLPPKFAGHFRDIRVRETRLIGEDGRLMPLTVQYEC